MGLDKKTKKLTAIFLILVMVLSLSACSITSKDDDKDEKSAMFNDNYDTDYDDKGRMVVNGNFSINDNKALYETWKRDEVETMYLTVSEGNKKENTDHTWEEINKYSAEDYAKKGVKKYQVEGILQMGDDNNISKDKFGSDSVAPNCIVSIRGQSSSKKPQKSYKIRINKNCGTWEGQSIINLNKHACEAARFRNTLSYRLMEDVDNMFSARTKFVHLYVKDKTSSGKNDKYDDYGMFTYVEQIGTDYLKNHGLDENGQLYKMNLFEFFRYKDNLKLKTDPDYKKTRFEDLLEIKGNDDHSKLLEMLDELNDYSNPIDKVFAKWFDEDNVFTWLAFHILTGNNDTQSRNAFLYSPENIDKFYFISWDNDGAFLRKEKEILDNPAAKSTVGIANYWGNVLISRVVKDNDYRKKLTDKIEELNKNLTRKKVQDLVDRYDSIVQKYVYALPDFTNLGANKDNRKKIVDSMASEVEENYKGYKESIKGLMPFFLGEPKKQGDEYEFGWSDSYSFDENIIKYDFTLAKDIDFKEIVDEKKDILGVRYKTKKLEKGKYYYKVVAKDQNDNSMIAYDQVTTPDKKIHSGLMCFYIEEDGSVKK